MSTGSVPAEASEEGLPSVERSLGGSIAQVHDSVRARQYQLELAQTAQVCVCVCVCMCVYAHTLSVCVYPCLSLAVCLFVCLSVCLTHNECSD